MEGKEKEVDSAKGSGKKVHFAWVFILVFIILMATFAPAIRDVVVDKDGGDHENSDTDKDDTIDYDEDEKSSQPSKKEFIDSLKGSATDYFQKRIETDPDELVFDDVWSIEAAVYYNGKEEGQGDGANATFSFSFDEALRNALDSSFIGYDLEEVLVRVTITSPIEHSFVIHDGEGKELYEDLLAIRELDKDLILEKIEEGKAYLLRMIDEGSHGAHKYYYAPSDGFEDVVHTIYTSSLVYSLLMIYDREKDEDLWDHILNCSEFILSMQNTDPDSKRYGAFHYSYDLDEEEKEKKFVVGTTSKTIYTLLELYNRLGDDKYLEAAIIGANWLLTMQNPDGTMTSYTKYRDGSWYHSTGVSLLYNGQVLSALSRMYHTTRTQKFFDGAEAIASYLSGRVDSEGCYLGDDYRVPNPISSSWVVLSLFDFYKASLDERYLDLVLNCSKDLLGRQITDEDDIQDFGRWRGTSYSSGNGWLNEVMVEIYRFTLDQDIDDCEAYKDAIIKVTRWLIQNTYSTSNSFDLEVPDKALGGLIRNYDFGYMEVRTDSVCHGVNAYVAMVDHLDDGILLSVPDHELETLRP